jgi:putative oxidoreductase
MLKDVETAVLRLTVGGLVAAHGAQKLFGAFDGPGRERTAGSMEAVGLKPGKFWGLAAELAEFGGGTLTALGLFNPLGQVSIIADMSMATAKVHWGKPIWASAGGAELPLTNVAAALAIALAGPGKYSLDEAFGIRLPGWVTGLTVLAATGIVTAGLVMSAPPPATEQGTAEPDAGADRATVGRAS